MKIDWKSMRRRIEAENREIRKRRQERTDEVIEVLKESGQATESFGRALMRQGMSGQPASRKFAEKMAIPKKRKRW